MRVEKIDITKTTMDVEDRNYFEIARMVNDPARGMRPWDEAMKDPSLNYELVEQYKETYKIMPVRHPEEPEPRKYAVKVDELDLFQDLIHVSEGFINSKVYQAKEEVRRNYDEVFIPLSRREGYGKATTDFKKLPWYKRLFFKSSHLGVS